MWAKLLIFLGSAGVTGAFFINLCATIFQCGCTFLWAGADHSCNIHMAGVKHCPWCAKDPTLALVMMVVSQLAISFWPMTCSWVVRLAAALAAFPVAGAVAALVYGLQSGYWK